MERGTGAEAAAEAEAEIEAEAEALRMPRTNVLQNGKCENESRCAREGERAGRPLGKALGANGGASTSQVCAATSLPMTVFGSWHSSNGLTGLRSLLESWAGGTRGVTANTSVAKPRKHVALDFSTPASPSRAERSASILTPAYMYTAH